MRHMHSHIAYGAAYLLHHKIGPLHKTARIVLCGGNDSMTVRFCRISVIKVPIRRVDTRGDAACRRYDWTHARCDDDTQQIHGGGD